MALLELTRVSKRFGGVSAVQGLSFGVREHEIMGLIGPNGAGKSTVFNLVTGVCTPSAGTVAFEGQDITGLRTDLIARRGIGRTFQHTALFKEFSVLENVLAACHLQSKTGFWGKLARSGYSREEEEQFRENAVEILKFMGMEVVAGEVAKKLPAGHQRKLGVCIGLAMNPRLLLLDEPLAGMNSTEVIEEIARIRRIRDERKVTVLLVEHNMKAVMEVCERIVVMNFGSKICEGPPAEVAADPTVIEAYLGTRRVA